MYKNSCATVMSSGTRRMFENCKRVLRKLYPEYNGYEIGPEKVRMISSTYCYGLADTKEHDIYFSNFFWYAMPSAVKRNLIMHELVHLIPRAANHGKKFQKIAADLKNYGYDIIKVRTGAPLLTNVPYKVIKEGEIWPFGTREQARKFSKEINGKIINNRIKRDGIVRI
ncbi:MAG: hypothetical protein ACOCP4_06110 [Candidatus Woesearchaeota archaeon]